MPLPILTVKVHRLLPLIETAMARGDSSRAIQSVLKIRRQSVLDAMRFIRGELGVSNRSNLIGLKDSASPNISRLGVANTPLRRLYSFRVRIEGKNINTGEIVKDEYVTVTTNNPNIKAREIKQTARDFFDQKKTRTPSDDIAVERVVIVSGTQAGAAGLILDKIA